MKRLLVLLVAGLALLAIPVATADGPDPVVTVQQGGMTFFYDSTAQVYRQVPDYATGITLGMSWSGTSWLYAVPVLTVDQLAAPVGTELSSVWDPPTLVELPTGSLYSLGTDGAYHYIPDLTTAVNAGVTWTGLDWYGATHISSPLQLAAPVGAPLAT
jgi:hypothetical protein